MKKIIKKVVVILLAVSMALPFVQLENVYAASGTIKISTNKTEVEKGDTVTVKVTISADVPLDLVGYTLKYDNKVFSCQGYSGIINEDVESEEEAGFTGHTVEYKFTALEAAEASAIQITYTEAIAILGNNNYDTIELKATNTTVKVSNHIASSNANLSNIEVSKGHLWPKFGNSSTNRYAVEVDNSVTSLTIACPTVDANAKVSFDSSKLKDLKVGRTDVTITVTAENGTTKKYVLEVTRLAAPEEQQTTTAKPTEQQTTTAVDKRLQATVNGVEYTVFRDISDVKLPAGYEMSVEKYNGTDIAVAYNKGNKVTLAYLKDVDDRGGFFIYNAEDNSFSPYISVNDLIVLTPESTLEGTISVKQEIDGVTITTWNDKEIADIYFFYAMNSEGDKGWYSYDSREESVQRAYALDITDKPVEENTTQSTTVSNEALESAKAEIDKLNRELTAAKDSRKLTIRMLIIVILLCICGMLIVGLVYLYLKYRSVLEERDMMEEDAKELSRQIDDAVALVAYTQEEVQEDERVEEVMRSEAVAEIEDMIQLNNEKMVDEGLLQSEINQALEKLTNMPDDDDDISFLYDEDDI